VINFQQAASLNATTEIKRLVGIRLAREQWKVEVENIFAASLAGMQIRVYDYARGTYSQHPSMIDRTPMLLQGSDSNTRAAVSVARMLKWRNKDYKNISVSSFWGVITLCLLVFWAAAGSLQQKGGLKWRLQRETVAFTTISGPQYYGRCSRKLRKSCMRMDILQW